MRWSSLPDACSAAWLSEFGHYATVEDVRAALNRRLKTERGKGEGGRRLSAVVCLALTQDTRLIASLRACGFKRTGKYKSNYHGNREVAFFMRPVTRTEVEKGEL